MLRRLSRRQLTVLIAGIGVLVSFAAAILAPVPYVILSPGPTLNTLGVGPGGRPLIQVAGHPTYQASGHLNLVTVSYQGGPNDSFNVFTALRAWLSRNDAVVPVEELFPPGKSQQEVVRQDTQQMASSQQTATAAALCQLRIDFSTIDTVVDVAKNLPAAGVMRKGDVISAVNGVPVTCRADARSLIRSHPPGSVLTLAILRAGVRQTVRVKTANVSGHPVVGVVVQETYHFPFSVKIRVGEIGGPSAGLMFTLGIIDKLTPGNLSAGRFIAGTGEITADGAIGPIGGIQQKMAGARAAGATVFLTPAANCPDTAGAVPAGLRLVKVRTLSDALAALRALATGRTPPSC